METGERSLTSFTMSTKDSIVMEFNLRRKHISRQLKSAKIDLLCLRKRSLFGNREDELVESLQPHQRLFSNLLKNEIPGSPEKR